MAETGDDEDTIIAQIRPLVNPQPPPNPEAQASAPVIRFRPPFIGTSAHDARGDAAHLVAENLVQQGLPHLSAFLLARAFVDSHASSEELRTVSVPFKDDEYDSIDASVWCRKVVAAIPAFLSSVLNGEIHVAENLPGLSQYRYSVAADRNRRQKMEDRHISIPTMELLGGKNDGTGLFGVFDGHGGAEVAIYAAAHLPDVFHETQGALFDKLKQSLEELDRRVAIRCKKEHWKSGSTAVCVAVDEKEICYGWVGDSAGYLMRSTEVTKVTKDHSPSEESEAKRVEAAGGILVWLQGEYRVNGILNLTRSLGDIAGRPMIISDADMLKMERDGGEYLVILACDGVSDVLTSAQIYETIQKYVESHESTEYQGIAGALCAAAKDEGSSDNLTAVIVFLKTVDELWALFSQETPND
ncbi:unnamed protein product, partial [Mesorhabditis belari]|uniref:PPM-type phosphatase domain-containing protein n=1 Tax=Mesorhabditis belari TaxID=2138241 RepID=A0AAF3E7V4_9BILA